APRGVGQAEGAAVEHVVGLLHGDDHVGSCLEVHHGGVAAVGGVHLDHLGLPGVHVGNGHGGVGNGLSAFVLHVALHDHDVLGACVLRQAQAVDVQPARAVEAAAGEVGGVAV